MNLGDDDKVGIDVALDGDPGIVASLALPGNPLAGAVYAGNHLLWKAKDMEADPIFAGIQPQLAIEGTRLTMPGATSEEQQEAAIHAYQVAESLSGVAQGMPAELLWHSGNSLTQGTNDYFGLTWIAGAPITVEQYGDETASVLQSTAKKVQEAAEQTKEDAARIAETLSRSPWIELSESEDEFIAMKTVLVNSLTQDIPEAVEAFEAEVAEETEEVTKLRDEVTSLKSQLATAKAQIDKSPVITDTQVGEHSENVKEYAKKIKELNKELRKQAREWEKAEARLVERIRKLEDDLRLTSKDLNHAIQRNADLSERFNDFRLESKRKLKEVREKNVKRISVARGEPDDDQVAELTRLLDDCEAMLKRLTQERATKQKIAEAERKLKQVEKQLLDQKKKSEEQKADLAELRAENTTLKDVVDKDAELDKDIEQVEKNIKQNQAKEVAQERRRRRRRATTPVQRRREQRDAQQDRTQDVPVATNEKRLTVLKTRRKQNRAKAGPPVKVLPLPKILPGTLDEAIRSAFNLDPRLLDRTLKAEEIEDDPNKIALWSLVLDAAGDDTEFRKKTPTHKHNEGHDIGKPSYPAKLKISGVKDTAPMLFYAPGGEARLHIAVPGRFFPKGATPAGLRGKQHALAGWAAYVKITYDPDDKTIYFFFNVQITQRLSPEKRPDQFEPPSWSLQLRKDGVYTSYKKFPHLATADVAYSGQQNEIRKALTVSDRWTEVKAHVTRVYLTSKSAIGEWGKKRRDTTEKTQEEEGEQYQQVATDLQEWLKLRAKKGEVSYVQDTNIPGTAWEGEAIPVLQDKLPASPPNLNARNQSWW